MLLFVLAQAEAAAVAPAQVEQTAGIVSYPPSFFAALNPSNALEMIGRLPGFSLDSGSSVRGFEGAAGNALIDGHRPSSKSDGLDGILQRIPASKVERIDLIHGGAPGIDMQGKTVIANVILKKGGEARALVSLSNQTLTNGRDFSGVRLEASGAFGDTPWEVAIRGGAGPDDGLSRGGGGQTIFASGAPPKIERLDSEGMNLNGSATGSIETPVLGGQLRVNGRLYQEKYKNAETDSIVSPSPSVERYRFAQQTTDTELGGRYTRTLGSAMDLELVALGSTRDRTNTSTSLVAGSATAFTTRPKSSETILRGVIKRRLGTTISLEAGAETASNMLDSRTRYLIDGVGQVVPAANVQVEERRTEVFFKGTWRPDVALTLDGALRYESSDISSSGDVVLAKSLQYAKPRLAVSWQAAPASQLRFTFERHVGQLNFNDFVASSNLATTGSVTAGNPNLNPQQAWVSDIAIEQQLWTGASLLLTGRHSKLTDVVDSGPVFAADGTVFNRPTNIGGGTQNELILDFTLPFGQLGWNGAMARGEVRRRWSGVRDPTTGAHREISGQEHKDWNLTISQDLPVRRVSLGVDFYGGIQRKYYRFNYIQTYKRATFVRPYAEWKPTRAWSLRMELPLVNAPDPRLRDSYEIFPGPRSAGGKPDLQERHFSFPRGFYFRIQRNLG